MNKNQAEYALVRTTFSLQKAFSHIHAAVESLTVEKNSNQIRLDNIRQNLKALIVELDDVIFDIQNPPKVKKD
jgi:hypothetical protein